MPTGRAAADGHALSPARASGDERVYLDWAATAPVLPCAIAAMGAVMAEVGNPSSVHHAGRRARARLEAARRVVAQAMGDDAADIVFTSGGTEANQLALAQAAGPIIVSAIEHASILEAVPDAIRAPVTADGQIDLEALARLVAEHRPSLVAVMAANNETGVIQPIEAVAQIAHAGGALALCDAIQMFGKGNLDPFASGADLVTISGHKVGGPPGVGALVSRPGSTLRSRQPGGGQERFRRGGTENLPGIVGFAAALSATHQDRWAAVEALRDGLEQRLCDAVSGVAILGRGVPRLPNIACIRSPVLSQEVQLMGLDLELIAIGAGAACSSGKIGPSHVLAAMGQGDAEARRAIRVSLGWSTQAGEVERFVRAWVTMHRRLSSRAS